MSFKKTLRAAALIAAVSPVCAPAFAADAASPLYLGASAGVYSRYNFDEHATIARDNKGKSSGKLYAGYIFNTEDMQSGGITHAVELSAYTSATNKTGFKKGATVVAGTGEMLGVGVGYAGSYKVAPQLSVTGRVGVGYTKGEVTYVGGAVESVKDASTTMGLGLAYQLDDNWSLHADWDRLPVQFSAAQTNKVNLLSVGARYRF